MNPLYNALRGPQQNNGPMQMIQQLINFKKSYKGNARQEVEALVRSGKISQAQLDQMQSMAGQIRDMMGGMMR